MTIQRKAAARLSAGSAEAARRLGRAAADASLGIKAVGAFVAWKGGPVLLAAAHQQPLLPVAASGAWCWAAWTLGKPTEPAAAAEGEAVEEADEEVEEAAEETEPGPVAGSLAAEFLAELHRLMPQPGDRMHVAQIAEQVFGSASATPRVRQLCAAVGVPVKAVRVRDRGSSTGVLRDDLPPVVDVVAAGHSDNNNTEGAPNGSVREGFYTAPHPTDPHRTEVHWITEKVS